jgi:hypothetical protein
MADLRTVIIANSFAAGSAKLTTATAGLTVNNSYPIVAMMVDAAPAVPELWVVTIDDTGKLKPVKASSLTFV